MDEILEKAKREKNNNSIKIDTIPYARVVGYYAPVFGFNKGKKEEFKDRDSIKN